MQFVLLASLWWLEEHDEPPSQARLAEHAGTDPMMTSQVLRKLEARGLLDRLPDPGDSRARRLRLTEPGSARTAGALDAVEAADEAYFATLGDGRDAFRAALATLAGNS